MCPGVFVHQKYRTPSASRDAPLPHDRNTRLQNCVVMCVKILRTPSGSRRNAAALSALLCVLLARVCLFVATTLCLRDDNVKRTMHTHKYKYTRKHKIHKLRRKCCWLSSAVLRRRWDAADFFTRVSSRASLLCAVCGVCALTRFQRPCPTSRCCWVLANRWLSIEWQPRRRRSAATTRGAFVHDEGFAVDT